METIKVMHVKVGETPKMIEVAAVLENKQKLVGGWLECVRLPYNIDLWINEEGLLLDLDLNFVTAVIDKGKPQIVHHIVGDVYFASHDGEGNTVSLNFYQQRIIREMFKVHREILLVRED